MNWQISKIEITSFKAFKNISLDFNDSSLLTLDGPNGFGKTSVFDAIELLLTGQIKRIHNLFAKVMTKNKRNYDDNLFWNNRSGENDLVIKIEFFNEERSLTLARHTPAKTLRQKTLNRADSFSQFTLYELPSFSSSDFSVQNIRENNYIEELFGKHFRENFCFLNYLEQGQNQLLHTKVDERKDALGNLFNITDIASDIKNCRFIEARSSKYLGDPERKKHEQELISEIESLRSMAQAELGSVKYKKLSTAEQQPAWDKEDLFPTYSSEILGQYLESTQKLLELLPLKRDVKIRLHNEKIENDIGKNISTLRKLVKFGIDIKKSDVLNGLKKELNLLAEAKDILQRGSTNITLAEAKTLPGWEDENLNLFQEQITARDILRKKTELNAAIVSEMTSLKAKLLEENAKLHHEDQTCPLCGADWITHQAILKAVDDRSKKIADLLNADGQSLIELTTQMTNELAPIIAFVDSRETILSRDYNRDLHTALSLEKVHISNIQNMAERLQNLGIPIDYSYTTNQNIIDTRLQDLLNLIRARKTEEPQTLPEDWQQTINAVCKSIQDFYLIDSQELSNKIQYISIMANAARNKKLREYEDSLKKIQLENEAVMKASEKVKMLRSTLETVERLYADHTISEIELIFHIFSGRLIQNYQRGLGLFIESRDGKQLRFLTAEKSEHDAVLSMSSGQVSALSLAFFLSLNKVYARVPMILIDDPAQSLDEVNVASLTDLLRCDFKHCQLIVSSHEEDISSYLRYRFTKAGLSTQSLNMQRVLNETP